MSSSGPEKQQWGRRLFASGGVLLLLGVLTLFYRPLSDMAWDVKHHFTATDGSASVELPWGWRQDETKGSEHRIVLSNSLREVFRFRAPDEITLRDLKTRFDAVEMAQEWERFEIRRMIPGDRLEPTPKDGFLRTNYRCADIKRSADRQISLTCFDLGGRWVVSLRGRSRSIEDLSRIMQSAANTAAAR